MNILLTSAGRRTYLVEYFKEALRLAGETGMVHAANSQSGPAFYAADRYVVTPLIYEPGYIPFLLDYCKKWQIQMVVSLFDIDLPVLAAHRRQFEEQGVFVVTADPEAVDICNDKWKTFCFLEKEGINVPQTWLEPEQALEAIGAGKVSWPLMVKPRWGMGSLAVYQAEDETELRVFVRKIQREIQKSYLKYESAADLEHCVLIQETLPGQELGMDVINDLQGQFRTAVVKKKLAMRSGETDGAETIKSPEAEAMGRNLSGLLRHRGNLDVDVFQVQGQYYVLELNARFGGGYPFTHIAGVNLPYALICWLKGREPEEACLKARIGVRGQKDIRMLVWNHGELEE